MLIEIDFNSNEAIYVQLQNQIIMGIATDAIREERPAVRQTAGRYSRNQYAHSEQSIFDPEADLKSISINILSPVTCHFLLL